MVPLGYFFGKQQKEFYRAKLILPTSLKIPDGPPAQQTRRRHTHDAPNLNDSELTAAPKDCQKTAIYKLSMRGFKSVPEEMSLVTRQIDSNLKGEGNNLLKWLDAGRGPPCVS